MITAASSTSGASATNAVGAVASAANSAGSEDRFLKLLVAQLKNQDPTNPMDNAQITSQIAQISTVSGLDKVNQSVQSLSSQLASLQMLQGSSLVGRSVLVEGAQLAVNNGHAIGAIDLDLPADSVKIDILSAGGQVLDTIDLGPLGAGRRQFDWDASANTTPGAPTYRVTATSGGNKVSATQLVRDNVDSVSSDNGVMNVQLHGLGSVAYSTVRAIL